MYHGNTGSLELHPGLCLTDEDAIAAAYGEYGGGNPDDAVVHEVTIDLDGLAVVKVDGFDRDTNEAPGDDHTWDGADVIVFTDEDPRGNAHTTWRLMTPAALARVALVTTVAAEDI